MKVTVLGCGALGSLMAFRLVRAGTEVQACQRPGPQLEALKSDGIVFVDQDGKEERARCRVASSLSQLDKADVTLVMVKAYQTEEAALQLSGHLTPCGIALTMQNGLGNAEILASVLGEEKVAAGTCTYGAHRVGPGRVAWGGDGLIRLGPWKKGVDLAFVAALLENSGLKTKLDEDPRKALWEKVILNAAVNTVSALTRLENGVLLGNPDTSGLIDRIVREGVEAAWLSGFRLENESMHSLVMSVLEKTAKNRTSMLQDVENGRRTEIDAIVGTLVEAGRKNGVSLPRLETVYALIRSLSFEQGKTRK